MKGRGEGPVRGKERVSIQNRQRKFKINPFKIRKTAGLVLKIMKKEKGALGLLFVNDRAIRKLNRQFRKINRPTDVLSFPGGEPLPGAEESWLGDIAISLETASRQATALGHSLAREISFLMVHGILHLSGWDHERSPAEAEKMYRLQRKIMERLKGL